MPKLYKAIVQSDARALEQKRQMIIFESFYSNPINLEAYLVKLH